MKNDSWEATGSELYLLNKQLHSLFEHEPSKGTPEKEAWDAEIKKLRMLFVGIHERRISLNIRDRKNRASIPSRLITTKVEIKTWRHRTDGLHVLVKSETNYQN